jgi:multicomponent Na+:H+ antiporter subunit D
MIAQLPVLWLFLPIFISLIMYLIKSSRIHWLIFPMQLFLMISFVVYVIAWKSDPSIGLIVFGGWPETIAITFYLDALNMTFVGLTLFFFTIIFYYSFKANYHEKRFFFFLTFLESVFLGMLMTNDLFNMFVFLELAALLVTLLITYRKGENALKAGLQYLLLASMASILFLLGVLLLYYVFGHLNIRLMAESMPTLIDANVVKLAYGLMITGFALKGAIFPLYAWLPKAHGVAPSSVSALLSGLIVKAALYLFMRIHTGMFGSPYQFGEVLFWLGMLSALAGVGFAMVQKDVKQILAYHTVSQVGLMLVGLSFDQGTSYVGGWMHIIHHAIFKGLLFLAVGVIIKTYQTKKVYDIHGVMKTLPWTGILLVVGMLSITGAPWFNGYVSKTMIKYAFADDEFKMFLFQLINLGTIISFSKLAMMLFGKPSQVVKVKRASISQHIPMTILAISSLILGIFYQPILESIYDFSAYAIHLEDLGIYVEYAFWVSLGFNLYYFVIKKDYRPLAKLRDLTMTFPTANFLLLFFLVSVFALIYIF